ncbi:MAG: uroporphyrinogen decarboxylase family protein [Clostridiales bacterium]|nr:uroporphyrinogen decarboxylase family protein [Clostridiales bacterium]
MNMYQWLEGVKASECKKPFPVLSYPAIQMMGITVRELISSAEYQARGMKLVADAVDSLASVSLMDLSVEAECFGSSVKVSDGEVPTVVGAIVTTPEEAEALKVPSVKSCRAGIYLDAIAKAKTMITDRPVFAGVIGPFSLAGRLVDVTEAMILCFEDPDMLKTVLEKSTQFLIDYIKAYKESGADGVLVAEPLAGMLSPDLAEEFSHPYVKRIVDACQDENFLVLYHNCGSGTVRMMEGIVSTGCKAFHFGNAVDMRDVMKAIPADVIAMGNVDPAGVFLAGTEEKVAEETTALLNDCGKYSNFVLSSGCDIPPLTPWANIRAFFRAAEEYNSKKGQ